MFIKCLLLLLAASFLSAGLVPPVDERIIGGRRTEIEEAPWQVSLRVKGSHSCGGAIYDNRTIITAAHCFYDNYNNLIDTRDFSVSVGSTSKSKGTVYGVEKKVHYPGYKKQHLSANDIAVLRLSKPLVFGDKVKAIPLAKKEPVAGTVATLTGWGVNGFIFFIPLSPEYLQGTPKTIVPLAICQSDYSFYIGEATLCTSVGACMGDSGGPLVVNRELVGIVSTGRTYCNSPTIFANVVRLQAWILSAIKGLSGSN